MSLEDLGFRRLCRAEVPASASTGAVSGGNLFWRAIWPFLALGAMGVAVVTAEKSLDAVATDEAITAYRNDDVLHAMEVVYRRFAPQILRLPTISEDALQRAFLPPEPGSKSKSTISEVEKALRRVVLGEISKDSFKTILISGVKNAGRVDAPHLRLREDKDLAREMRYTDEELDAYQSGEGYPTEMQALLPPMSPRLIKGVEYAPSWTYDDEYIYISYLGPEGEVLDKVVRLKRPTRATATAREMSMPIVQTDEGEVEVPLEDPQALRAYQRFETSLESESLKRLLERAQIPPLIPETMVLVMQPKRGATTTGEEGGEKTDKKTILNEAYDEVATLYGLDSRAAGKRQYDALVDRVMRLAEAAKMYEGNLTRERVEETMRYLARTEDLIRLAEIEEKRAAGALHRGDTKSAKVHAETAQHYRARVKPMAQFHLYQHAREQGLGREGGLYGLGRAEEVAKKEDRARMEEEERMKGFHAPRDLSAFDIELSRGIEGVKAAPRKLVSLAALAAAKAKAIKEAALAKRRAAAKRKAASKK